MTCIPITTIERRKIKMRKIMEFETNLWTTKGNPWLIRNLLVNLPDRMAKRMATLSHLLSIVLTAMNCDYWFDMSYAPKNAASPRYYTVKVYNVDKLLELPTGELFSFYVIEAEGGNVWKGRITIFNFSKPIVIVEGEYFSVEEATVVLSMVIAAISHYLATHNDP